VPPPAEPEPEPEPQPEPAPPVDPPAPASDLTPLLGAWHMQTLNLGGVTYENVRMNVEPDGSAHLLSTDEDSCHWQPGDPVFRNLTGSGLEFTGERYLGPCVSPPEDWRPVTIRLSADGTEWVEESPDHVRTWIKLG
jgi:hypothetical protein